MNSPVNSNGRKASDAKLRGNKVHNQLKILCLRWMKKHRPEAVRRLKSQAQKEANVG